jgi:acyl-CoA synthetase (AMP-forming)/AMP-acid ligase II
MIIHRSPYPDVTVPDMAYTPFVLQAAHRLGDKPALVDGVTGRTLTFAQVIDGVRCVAANLAARGFRKGDVFAILCPNVLEYALVFHGVATLGGIVTTMNPLYRVDEVAFQLNDTGAAYLLTVPACLETAIAAARKTGVREIFVLGEAPAGTVPFAALLEEAGDPPAVAIDPRVDLLMLPYSSGTTGLPKGVMLTHHNLVVNMRQAEDTLPCREGDTSLAVLPFFHIFGLACVLNDCLYRGATLVVMARFEAEQFLRVMQDRAVTTLCLVPPIVQLLAKDPRVNAYDLSRLRSIVCGAAPLGAAVEQACVDRLGCQIIQGFGMTELSGVTLAIPLDPAKTRPGSVGVLVPSMEARVVDVSTGEDLGPGARGELWLRGSNVMRGYLGRLEATAAMLDAEGWLHTGDVGYVDAEGYFSIVDRIKELIKYKGMQVAPAELEAVLLAHPAIADAAVVGVPDEAAGEVPKAFIVPRAAVDAEEVLAYVAGHVAPYKKIRQLEVVAAIPRSASGKILRRLLMEQERERALKSA